MAQPKLIIDFWDVGQGDGTGLRLPGNQLVLIDVGPKGSPIIDWLTDRLRPVHAALVTHNDDDHAGSLPSLVKLPGISIRTVYMLLDREKHSSRFQKIWWPVREEEKRGRLTVRAPAADTVIWAGHDYRLEVVYPSFSENIEARRPNDTSAVVCLYYQDQLLIIWPGDAPMQIVAEKCDKTQPNLLHGPHHGGPTDRKKVGFEGWVEALAPERVFVSVGTNNSHSLPSAAYLSLQSNRGCRVICTQLTRSCDTTRLSNETPVLQTAALLGLRAARHGVPCRGCFRLTIERGIVLSDPWDSEHLAKIQQLRRPQCLRSN